MPMDSDRFATAKTTATCHDGASTAVGSEEIVFNSFTISSVSDSKSCLHGRDDPETADMQTVDDGHAALGAQTRLPMYHPSMQIHTHTTIQNPNQHVDDVYHQFHAQGYKLMQRVAESQSRNLQAPMPAWVDAAIQAANADTMTHTMNGMPQQLLSADEPTPERVADSALSCIPLSHDPPLHQQQHHHHKNGYETHGTDTIDSTHEHLENNTNHAWTSTPPSTRLPYEVMRMIASSLVLTQKDMLSLSLVSMAWRVPATEMLMASVGQRDMHGFCRVMLKLRERWVTRTCPMPLFVSVPVSAMPLAQPSTHRSCARTGSVSESRSKSHHRHAHDATTTPRHDVPHKSFSKDVALSPRLIYPVMYTVEMTLVIPETQSHVRCRFDSATLTYEYVMAMCDRLRGPNVLDVDFLIMHAATSIRELHGVGLSLTRLRRISAMCDNLQVLDGSLMSYEFPFARFEGSDDLALLDYDDDDVDSFSEANAIGLGSGVDTTSFHPNDHHQQTPNSTSTLENGDIERVDDTNPMTQPTRHLDIDRNRNRKRRQPTPYVFPKLTHLRLTAHEHAPVWGLIGQLSLPSLTHIEFDWVYAPSRDMETMLMSTHRHVRSIHVAGWCRLDLDWMTNLAVLCPVLETLVVCDSDMASCMGGGVSVTNHDPNTVDNTPMGNHDSGVECVTCVMSLTVHNLKIAIPHGTVSFSHMYPHFTRLTHLTVTGYLGRLHLAILAIQCPLLTRLSLQSVTVDEDEMVVLLGTIGLVELSCSFVCDGLTNRVLARLTGHGVGNRAMPALRSAQTLRRIVFSRCTRLTADAIWTCLRHVSMQVLEAAVVVVPRMRFVRRVHHDLAFRARLIMARAATLRRVRQRPSTGMVEPHGGSGNSHGHRMLDASGWFRGWRGAGPSLSPVSLFANKTRWMSATAHGPDDSMANPDNPHHGVSRGNAHAVRPISVTWNGNCQTVWV